MSLSFYYEFTAPAATTPAELEKFLQGVEQLAISLGFGPTELLNVPFDTKERRDFARHLGGSFILQDEKLKGVALPSEGQVRDHDPISCECRLIPQRGVVLVLTDAQGCEACFGFFKFPERVIDIHGSTLADTGLEGRWWFRDFVDSPDPRYREIVKRFEEAGYAKQVKDECA
jgi:hypothetical protein